MIGELREAAHSITAFAVEVDVTFTAGMANPCFLAAAKSSITFKGMTPRASGENERAHSSPSKASISSHDSRKKELRF